jgi:outer membrane protein
VIYACALFISFTAAAVPLAATEAPPQPLTLEAAVARGTACQPSVQQAKAQQEASAGRLLQARAAFLPQIGGLASYQRTTTNFVSRPGYVLANQRLMASSPTNNSANFWSLGASATLLVYDFHLSIDRYRAARSSAESLRHNTQSVTVSTAYEIRAAYFNAIAQAALVQVAEQAQQNQRRHQDQVAGFVAVGTRASIDLAQARTDLANAQVDLVRAQNDQETALLLLNQAMGLDSDQAFVLATDTMAPLPQEQLGAAALAQSAQQTRPDLLYLVASLEAAARTVQSLQAGYLPSLGLGANYSDQGPDLKKLGWNWNVAATVNWNAFSGGLTAGQVHEARATRLALQATCRALRQQVHVDVESARLAIAAGKQTVVAAHVAADSAAELLRCAEARYQTGVGSFIEWSDAQLALRTAAAQQVQADFHLSTARAALLKALGEV